MEYNTFIVLIFGLVIGSFLNMLIYRLPLGISLINPKRSICTKCNYTIKWYENIPVLSYLFLQGKCSNCKTKISLIYPIVEIITSIVTIVLYKKLGLNSEFYFISIIFYLLILLSFIDLKYKAVPDYLLVILVIITLGYLALYKIDNLSLFFMFAGGIFMIELLVTFYVQNIKSYFLKDESLKTQKAMGEGDIPIIAVIGGILGIQFGMLAIFLSAIFAIIPSIVNIVSKKEIETPFIPYLSLGLFITFINETSLQQLLEGLHIV
ncbi:MAG: prepilin peptidase [Arcobacteraceae bacterium]